METITEAPAAMEARMVSQSGTMKRYEMWLEQKTLCGQEVNRTNFQSEETWWPSCLGYAYYF